MDVSVIIVNYNTIELTLNCINSIFTHTLGIDFEVIVVDNNSDDGSGEILRLDKRIVKTPMEFVLLTCYLSFFL